MAGIEVIRAHFLTLDLIPIQENWDQAREAAEAAKAFAVREERFEGKEPAVHYERAEGDRLRLNVEHGNPGRDYVGVSILCGKDPIDDHESWRKAMRWKPKIEAIDGAFVVAGTERNERDRTHHAY